MVNEYTSQNPQVQGTLPEYLSKDSCSHSTALWGCVVKLASSLSLTTIPVLSCSSLCSLGGTVTAACLTDRGPPSPSLLLLYRHLRWCVQHLVRGLYKNRENPGMKWRLAKVYCGMSLKWYCNQDSYQVPTDLCTHHSSPDIKPPC